MERLKPLPLPPQCPVLAPWVAHGGERSQSVCYCPAHVHVALARSPGTKAAQRGGSPGNWVISHYLGPSGSLARAVRGRWAPTLLPIPARWLNGSVITGVGLVWRFPCAAWKGATYCFTTKITNYFIEGWSCRELSGQLWCGTAPAPPVLARAWGSPSCAPTVPTSIGKGAQVMEKEEGEHQGQGLPCPYSHLSLLVLTLAMGTPFPGHARGPPAPQLTLWVGDRLHAVLGAAAALAPGTPGWHLHPAALPAQQCHLPGRLASCAVPPLPCWGRRWEPAQAPAPLPCPPELLMHCLAWQPVLGVPQDAAPCWHPLSMAPPQSDLLTAPTIAWRIKIIKQQVHFPGLCPTVPA